MDAILIFDKEQTLAFNSGRKTQHRVPLSPQPKWEAMPSVADGSTPIAEIPKRLTWSVVGTSPIDPLELVRFCPYGEVGEIIFITANLGFGKTEQLSAKIVDLSVESLDDISDEGVMAEGLENWTQLAYRWDRWHAKRGFPWETNPISWKFVLEKLS